MPSVTITIKSDWWLWDFHAEYGHRLRGCRFDRSVLVSNAVQPTVERHWAASPAIWNINCSPTRYSHAGGLPFLRSHVKSGCVSACEHDRAWRGDASDWPEVKRYGGLPWYSRRMCSLQSIPWSRCLPWAVLILTREVVGRRCWRRTLTTQDWQEHDIAWPWYACICRQNLAMYQLHQAVMVAKENDSLDGARMYDEKIRVLMWFNGDTKGHRIEIEWPKLT